MRLYGLIAALLVSGLARADAVRWYVLEMQGQRAGWMVERETVVGDTIVTTSESSLTIRRGETEISISMGSEFIETVDGRPIEMTATANMGSAPSSDRYVFEDDGVIWTSSQLGKKVSKTLPLPEGRWLPPAAAGRYVAKRLEAGADEIVVRTIDPSSGLEPILTTRTGFTEVTIEVLGRSVKAVRCRSLSSLFPDAEGIEFIDHNGNLLRSELNLGAVSIAVIAADEELAKSKLDPPELMRSMFIKPDRVIREPYRKRSGTFIVSATTGTLPELPSAGSQSVEVLDERSVRVRRVVSALGEPVLGADIELLTSPSAMLESEDPRVVELTRSALLGGRMIGLLGRNLFGNLYTGISGRRIFRSGLPRPGRPRRSLGERLKNQFSGWRVGVVTSEQALAKQTGLPFVHESESIHHGGLRVKVYSTNPLP